MPIYCCVFHCDNDSDATGLYKFPLHDPAQLQQWLRNMGRENWTPSPHHHICQEHFAPSCFKERWGVRYLDNDAVPTVFQKAEKRKATEQHEESKRLRADGNQSLTVSGDRTGAVDAVERQSASRAVQLYEITIDPCDAGLVELSDSYLHTDLNTLASADGFETRGNIPLTVFQTVDGTSYSGENAEVVVMSEGPAGQGQDEPMSGINAVTLIWGRGLLMKDSTLRCTHETVASLTVEDVTLSTEDLFDTQEGHKTQVTVYFETIPVFPFETAPRFTSHPETVLTSALSSRPIPSTLPLVSKYTPPPPPSYQVVTMETFDTDHGEGSAGEPEDDSMDHQDHQLEEHCYHKNTPSQEQLVSVEVELQKKQRRHRHLKRILGLENTVGQLRQSNLHIEERVQLLEKACIQTSASVADAVETVAILCEEDSAAYLYTLLTDVQENL
ncbi:THAP domain-containing protein 5-like [Solea senegalensis]|nr:THAP domain-containing protein 5-like [Solea senegalensis]KAG7478535.1 THAP domain-containing protein 5-like [Solea senegalensis]